ncbi:MAG: L-threonylcarbamoyladenylate synthase [Candidatus Aminicenantes bacterium]|nr:L-threonylcarbamoyladenylate synthase [Candidatus Aminicenantes bacterium]
MIIIPFADILAPGNFKAIGDCLHDDGVIAYPTDTLYGLGGKFFSSKVIARIDAMKQRGDLPYSVAVADLAMLESLSAEIPDIFRSRLKKLLPGKFTFLFKSNPAIDPLLLKNSDRIGIRIPGLPLLLKMISALGFPLVSTSVNLSGRPPLNDPQRIVREFPELDLLIDGGVLPASAGSTLVDVTVSPPMIVRPGADLDRIMAIV